MEKSRHSKLTPLEILTKARALLKRRGAWCQHSNALNRFGIEEDPWSARAVKWCAIGAIEYELGKLAGYYIEEVLCFLRQSLPDNYFSVAKYNDEPSRKKRDIIALYDRAIELARQNEDR